MPSDKKAFPWISTALIIAGAAFLVLQFYRAVDAKNFNLAMQRKVESNHLIGKSEDRVIAVLGTPSNRVVYPNGDFTLNYFPGVAGATTQVPSAFSSRGDSALH